MPVSLLKVKLEKPIMQLNNVFLIALEVLEQTVAAAAAVVEVTAAPTDQTVQLLSYRFPLC